MDWSTGGQRVEQKVDAQRVDGILRRGRRRLGWEDCTKRDCTKRDCTKRDCTKRDCTKWERNGGPEEKLQRKTNTKKTQTQIKGRNQTSLNRDDRKLGEQLFNILLCDL